VFLVGQQGFSVPFVGDDDLRALSTAFTLGKATFNLNERTGLHRPGTSSLVYRFIVI
jgi:hypothetical protein